MSKLIQFGSAGVSIPNFPEIKANAETAALQTLIQDNIQYEVTAYQLYSADAFIFNGTLEPTYDELLDQFDSDIVGFECDICNEHFTGDDVIGHMRHSHAEKLAELTEVNLHTILESMRKTQN